MKLSIIIPFYNAQNTIHRCLESIINSKPALNYEIILIDDGSRDKTIDIIKSFSADNNIRIYRQINKGVSVARNLGIKKARGGMIMFVDADDHLTPDWQQIIKAALNENPYSDYIIFSSCIKKIPDPCQIPVAICGYNTSINMSAPWSKIYKRTIINKHHLSFNPQIINGEDLLFNLEYNFYAKRITFIDKGFYRYTNNSESSTHKLNPAFIKSNLLFNNNLQRILNKYGSQYNFINALSSINAYLVLFERYCYTYYFNRAKINNLLASLQNGDVLNTYKKYQQYFSAPQLFLLHLITKRQYKVAYILVKIKHKIGYNKHNEGII